MYVVLSKGLRKVKELCLRLCGKLCDTTSFGQKPFGQTSFSQHITVMSAGQNAKTSEGMGAKLVN